MAAFWNTERQEWAEHGRNDDQVRRLISARFRTFYSTMGSASPDPKQLVSFAESGHSRRKTFD